MMTMLSKLTLLKEGGGVWVRNFEKTEELACTLYISNEKPSSLCERMGHIYFSEEM